MLCRAAPSSLTPAAPPVQELPMRIARLWCSRVSLPHGSSPCETCHVLLQYVCPYTQRDAVYRMALPLLGKGAGNGRMLMAQLLRAAGRTTLPLALGSSHLGTLCGEMVVASLHPHALPHISIGGFMAYTAGGQVES